MHGTIDVRLTVSIDRHKTIPLSTSTEFITDQNVELVLLEALLETLDAAHLEILCGKKHTSCNGVKRFQQAGIDISTAVTTAGKHELSIVYAEDTAKESCSLLDLLISVE